MNIAHPTQVHTDITYRMFRSDFEAPGREEFAPAFQPTRMLPILWIESRDVGNTLPFLASGEARYLMGIALPVYAGALIR